MNNILLAINRYILAFLKAQLIVTLVSLPILINWGIPISLMSVVGNFIFSPILTVFLMLSSLIFFTELLYIPNGGLIYLLQSTTNIWEYLLSFGKKTWLIGIAQPSNTIQFLLLALGAMLILRIVFKIMSKVIIVVMIAIACVGMYNHLQNTKWPQKETTKNIPQAFKKLLVTQTPQKTLRITDNGLFARKQSPEKFISFELKPYLIKNFGSAPIEQIILKNPGSRSFQAAQELCETLPVKKISVAYFEKSLSKFGWKKFFALKETCNSQNIEFERFTA